jgi:hypothetical protein
MRSLSLSVVVLSLAGLLCLPSLAAAQGSAGSASINFSRSAPEFRFTGLAPQYRLEAPAEQQSGGGSSEELSIDERRAIQARLKLRRKMVGFHQVFALTAAVSLVAADVVGLGNATSLARGEPERPRLEPPLAVHRILAATALTSYMAAGITAWTMPPALRLNRASKNKKKVDSGDLHVAFSIVHGIAMATVITTGLLQANVAPAGKGWDALVATHTAAGITAAGFVIAAGITIGTL